MQFVWKVECDSLYAVRCGDDVIVVFAFFSLLFTFNCANQKQFEHLSSACVILCEKCIAHLPKRWKYRKLITQRHTSRALYYNSWNSRHLIMCAELNFFLVNAFSGKKWHRNSRLKHSLDHLLCLQLKKSLIFFSFVFGFFFLPFVACAAHTAYISVLYRML